tara:strand:- start:4196 stop:6922 length:2727 start_codon:yes stop_codon:yes gene_type:complete
MPVASGSLAFLGAARFQGYWNASTNMATGSGVPGAVSGVVSGLFATGSSTLAGGYAMATTLTASIGDYWQVTGSGTHNVDGNSSWNLNDWCIFSGSQGAGASANWARLSFDDTIASIVIGDLSATTFHIGSTDYDKHIIFASGSAHSGSDNFIFDYTNNRVGIGVTTPQSALHIEHTDTTTWPSDGAASTGELSDYLLTLRNNTDTQHAFAGVAFDVTSETDADSIGAAVLAVSDNATSTAHDANIVFATNDGGDDGLTERMRITHNGNVGIGDPANIGVGFWPNTSLHILEGDGAAVLRLESYSDIASNDPVISFKRARGTGASPAIVQDGDNLGELSFTANDGVDNISTAAAILVEVDGTPGADDMPGRMVFSTNGGSATSTERMRIDSSGRVGIGVTDPDELLEVAGDVKVSGGNKLYLFDSGGEHLSSDGTDLTIASGQDINLTATTDVNIPANVGLTFGDDGEKIEGDGTDLTIASSAKINLSATSDVHIPQGVGLIFDTAGTEKIESDGLDLTISSGKDIHLSAAQSVDIPENIPLMFGTGSTGEKIEGDGTDLTISAGTAVNIAAGTLDLSAQTVDVTLNSAVDALNFDSNTLSIDAANNRVGIGTASPARILDAVGQSRFSGAMELTGTLILSSSLDFSKNGDDESKILIADHVADALTIAEGTNDYLTFSTTNANERIVSKVEFHLMDDGKVLDDKKLYFGTAKESFIEYRETSNNFLVISGSHEGGLVLSGSQVHFVADGSKDFRFSAASGNNVDIYFSGSSSHEGRIRWIGGSDYFAFYDDIRLLDNEKVEFGTSGDSHIKYNGTSDNFLVISGSVAGGLVLSGSSVVVAGSDLTPDVDNTQNLGSPSKRWAVAHLGDLHLRNDRGDWTVIEEADYLSITNNLTNKRYKFVLEEIED